MATANFSIQPEDGWVAVTSAAVDFIKIRQYPESQPFYVTSATSQPKVNSTPATGTITIAGLPVANETVTVDNSVFVFKASAAGALEVTIGADAAATATNLAAKITANEPQVAVTQTVGGVISLAATATGAAGNSVVLTEAATNVTVSGSGTLAGGVTGVRGFRVDDEEFWCDVPVTDSYYVRAVNPKPDTDLLIDVFYVLS